MQSSLLRVTANHETFSNSLMLISLQFWKTFFSLWFLLNVWFDPCTGVFQSPVRDWHIQKTEDVCCPSLFNGIVSKFWMQSGLNLMCLSETLVNFEKHAYKLSPKFLSLSSQLVRSTKTSVAVVYRIKVDVMV